MKITKEIAEDIWEILVTYGGASARGEEDFVFRVMEQDCQEYRFGGELGFGGKIHLTSDQWRVSCYKENQTADTLRLMTDINKQLILLRHTVDNPLGSLARCLHERYSKRYPNRYVEVEPLERSTGSRLCVIFRHSNHPYRPYLRVSFQDAILLETRVNVDKEHLDYKKTWKENDRVSYEDPEMEDKLDILVARVVETTPQLETVSRESGGMADTVDSKPTA